MINEQVLQGNWNEIKGKIRSKWGQLTNDDLQSFDGNVDRLVGLIQRKTGEAATQSNASSMNMQTRVHRLRRCDGKCSSVCPAGGRKDPGGDAPRCREHARGL